MSTAILNTDDLRISHTQQVIPPVQLHDQIPITVGAALTTATARSAIHRILTGEDDRLLVVIGPCSIHDVEAATEYAGRLYEQREALKSDLEIVMRVYFEKPRTTVGWKGLINDPGLNGHFDINKGLRMARTLLRDINEMGLPAATEYLDLITPQYVSDLIAWGAIGARTTESQVHRELASGLSCPVGFKNATDGTIQVAIDAIGAALRSHHFLSVTKEGQSAIFTTTGNVDSHLILRGGNNRPNYDQVSVGKAVEALEKANLPVKLMIDCSHANSQKMYQKQLEVNSDIAHQIRHGNKCIAGVMIESHLVAGQQKVVPGEPLTYGQSITDGCLGWTDSLTLLNELADAVRKRRTT